MAKHWVLPSLLVKGQSKYMEEEVKEKESWSHAWIYLECQLLFDHRALDDHYLICSFVDVEREV